MVGGSHFGKIFDGQPAAILLLFYYYSHYCYTCVVVSAVSDAWTDSVALLHVDAAALVTKHISNIVSQLTVSSALSQVCPSVCLSSCIFVRDMWTVDASADADLQDFVQMRSDSGYKNRQNLQMRTDVDTAP